MSFAVGLTIHEPNGYTVDMTRISYNELDNVLVSHGVRMSIP